jgi:hypothetical protein
MKLVSAPVPACCSPALKSERARSIQTQIHVKSNTAGLSDLAVRTGTTEQGDQDSGGPLLQSSTEKQYDEDNQDDSADPDSAHGSVSVITAASAKQQK